MATRDSNVESVSRALDLLSILARHNDGGARLSDLCVMTGLSQGTAHRLLRTLLNKSFVEQDYSTRRYHLGNAFLALGATTVNKLNLQEVAEPTLRRLSGLTGDTVLLMIRNGLECLCISRIDGPYPIKAITVSVGVQRPLGYGSGPLVLLAFSDDKNRADLVRRVSRQAQRYPFLEYSNITRLIAETRARGYAYLEGHILRTMATLALPVIDFKGNLYASVSLVTQVQRLAEPRRAEILALMREAVAEIVDEISPWSGNGTLA